MPREEFESNRMLMQESFCKTGRRSFLRRLTLGFSAVTGCARPAAVPAHLFACNVRELTAIARNTLNHEILAHKIQRSSSGDQVIVLVDDQRQQNSQPPILVISTKRPPTLLQPPKGFWAVADDLTVVAWRGTDTELNFRNGFIQKTERLSMPVFAPGAAYYCVAGPDNLTSVYATDRPGVLLAHGDFVTQNIFCRGGRVYLFGFDRNAREPGIVGSIFRNVSGKLHPESDIRIRPLRSAANFVSLDLDPQSDLLLCGDTRDEFGAKWFLYDLHSRVLTDIGKANKFGLFLQDKLIKVLRSQTAPRREIDVTSPSLKA
jgi:hypothetical protein